MNSHVGWPTSFGLVNVGATGFDSGFLRGVAQRRQEQT